MPWVFWRGPRYGYGYGNGYAPASGCGCLAPLIGGFFFLVLITTMAGALLSADACSSTYVTNNNSTAIVQTSTKARTKLPSSECTPISLWYEDLAEWIDEPSALTPGMQRFYEKTGVQPYLIVTTSIQGEKEYDISQVETYLRDRYDTLFGQDDGHLILLFCEPYDGVYDPYLLIGESAQSVIDLEAEDIIYDTIDAYYSDTSLSNSAYFGKIFSASADAIMAGSTGANVPTTTTAPSPARTTSPVLTVVAAVACGAAIAYVVLRIIRKKQEAQS